MYTHECMWLQWTPSLTHELTRSRNNAMTLDDLGWLFRTFLILRKHHHDHEWHFYPEVSFRYDKIWSVMSFINPPVNSFPPWQNGRHFTDNLFRCIFVNEKFCILIQISLKFVFKHLIDNNLALVKIMAWRSISDKPLSEPMLTRFTDAYMWH